MERIDPLRLNVSLEILNLRIPDTKLTIYDFIIRVANDAFFLRCTELDASLSRSEANAVKCREEKLKFTFRLLK